MNVRRDPRSGGVPPAEPRLPERTGACGAGSLRRGRGHADRRGAGAGQQALATALLNTALSQVASSEAQYLDVVGDPPGNLEAGTPPNRNAIPSSVAQAVSVSQEQHPAIQATKFAVDAASFQVKSAEGAALPTLSLTGQVENSYALSDQDPNNLPGVDVLTQNQVSGTVGAQLSVPIYEGGLISPACGRRRRRCRSAGSRSTISAIRSARRSPAPGLSARPRKPTCRAIAPRCRRQARAERRRRGTQRGRQRTTLDVLNAQTDVITAQILLAGAQRDTIVAAYTLSSAVGSLLPDRLAWRSIATSRRSTIRPPGQVGSVCARRTGAEFIEKPRRRRLKIRL